MSDTPKWTPGPWHHHDPNSMRVCDGSHDLEAGCWIIAEAEIVGIERETAKANAHLIAAAPELYEALVNVMALIQQGRLVRDTSNDPNLDWALRQIPLVKALAVAQATLAKARGEQP